MGKSLVSMPFAGKVIFSLQLPGGLAASIMAPSGRPKKIHQPYSEWQGLFNVLPYGYPFMEDHIGRIRMFDVLRKTEAKRLFAPFFAKGAKELIPYNKYHTKVLIKILRVGCMVNAMVRGSGHEPFQKTQFVNILGMNEYSIDLCGRIHEHDIDRPESAKSQRNEVEHAVQRLEYRRAEPNGKVEFLRRMMGHMHGPEKTAKMIHIV